MRSTHRSAALLTVVGFCAVLGLSACDISIGSSGDDSAAQSSADEQEPGNADDGDGGDDAAEVPDDVTKAPKIINSAGGSETYDCVSQNIAVNASSFELELLGECHAVTINGSNVTASIASATAITINGANVKVTYGGNPNVNINGVNSTADPA